MIFNRGLTKQAQEVILSRKIKKLLHLGLSFNVIPWKNSMSQRHFGLTSDVKLNFIKHIKDIHQKVSKAVDLLRRFQSILDPTKIISTDYI